MAKPTRTLTDYHEFPGTTERLAKKHGRQLPLRP